MPATSRFRTITSLTFCAVLSATLGPGLASQTKEPWPGLDAYIETAIKTKNMRRDPWAQLCAFTDKFFGEWLYVEGRAEIVSLPEAMDLLIDYYKRFPGENPDWDDYRARMERERRVLIRISIERAGPDRQG